MPSDISAFLVIGCFVGGYIIISKVVERPPVREARASANKQSGAKQGKSTSQDPPQNQQVKWYTVLGVQEDSSMEAIRAAYFQKIQAYHPDKVASLGDEFQRLAELKSKEINAAYDVAKKLQKNSFRGGFGA